MDDRSCISLVAEQFRRQGRVTLNRENGTRLVRLAERGAMIERHQADLREGALRVPRPKRR